MPFRCRQKMQSYAAGKIFYQVGTPNPDTGLVEYRDVSQQEKLPDSEMTDLAASLKAGVSLEQVNCKLVNGSNAVASLNNALNKAAKKAVKKSATNNTDGGVENAE